MDYKRSAPSSLRDRGRSAKRHVTGFSSDLQHQAVRESDGRALPKAFNGSGNGI